MKKLLFIAVLFFLTVPLFSQVAIPNTNTIISIDNIKQEVNDTTLIIQQWKEVSQSIKNSGMSLTVLITICMLVLISIVVIGVIVVMLLNIIEFVTPPEIDKKLDKMEDWITKYLIKLPISIITGLRSFVKKKT